MRRLNYLLAMSALVVAAPSAAASYIDYDVYASNDVTIAGGSYGAIAAGTFTTSHTLSGGNYETRVASSTALTSEALSFSQLLSGLAPTGTFALTGPTRGTLTGTGTGINVFNVSGADFASVIRLTFAGIGDGAIVNVSGGIVAAPTRYDFGNLVAQNVIFNFHEASAVSFAGADIRGSILAPSADLSYAGGSIAGTVAARSFDSAGTEIGGTGFVTPQVTAVPEFATWAMLILGFGGIGGVLRRPATTRRLQRS